MAIRPELAEMAEQMRGWRHHIHQHPETAFCEHDTADFLAGLLTEWNIPIHRGLAGTGVVGTLKAGNSSRSIGLRADMDALDLDESNGFGHKSTRAGKMHACGHDGHMAMLLGAACHLAKTRQFDGTIYFIFQPAEENEAGGRRMVQEGLFDLFPADAVYGMHNMPLLPEGKMALRTGALMASADFFHVTVTGKGTHGAWPHKGIDVISIASEIVLALQHVVARTIDPLEAAVISVTKINAGHTTNVMPETATLAGTTRAFSSAVQDHMEQKIKQVCDGIAAAYGATVDVRYDRRYPPTVNHPKETEFAARTAARIVGAENFNDAFTPVMGAEDFGWMLMSKPGNFIFIGNGPADPSGKMLHSPHYDFNDRILPIGASYWVELAESWLPLQ